MQRTHERVADGVNLSSFVEHGGSTGRGGMRVPFYRLVKEGPQGKHGSRTYRTQLFWVLCLNAGVVCRLPLRQEVRGRICINCRGSRGSDDDSVYDGIDGEKKQALHTKRGVNVAG